MHSIDACSVCGEQRRTIVSQYNRLIFLESMWQSDLARFNYALCHGCGLVYATRRPDRKEYDFLYGNFNEFLNRKPSPGSFNQPQVPKAMAAEIDRDFLPWWEVRLATERQNGIRGRLRWDLQSALKILPHFIQHVPLEGAKVLHIRAKDSTLADMLKRLLGAAQVDLITLFPPHKYLAEKNDGIRVQTCLDYEDFKIPFDEKYDLIIENHILIHMLNATQTFQVFKSHLKDGGRLFLTAELADDELFRKGKNLLAELRPFHYQQFDTATLDRILRRYGFEPQFLLNRGEGDPELFGLATLQKASGEFPRINREDLAARLSMYQQWHDESILALPKDRAEALYGDELKAIWDRIEGRGGFEPNKKGKLKGFRAFPEAEELPISELVIGPAFAAMQSKSEKSVKKASQEKAKKPKKKEKKRVAGGKKKHGGLKARLRRTRVGRWLSARLQKPTKPGGAPQAADSRRA